MAEVGSSTAMERFAVAAGIEFVAKPEPPAEGGLLSVSGRQLGPGAKGPLPEDGGEATAAFLYYSTTDSDNNTVHHPYTVVVARIPESMGFAPYVSFETPGARLPGLSPNQREWSPEGAEKTGLGGGKVSVFEGMSDDWIAQLFSPSMIDYLARSSDGFAFELSAGVLCAVRPTYLSDEGLKALWADCGHVAKALRSESEDEIASGTESSAAAKPAKGAAEREARVVNALEAFGTDREVPHLGAAKPRFRSILVRNPWTWTMSLLHSVLILLVVNVPAIAIPIVLAVNHKYTMLLVIEAIAFLIIFWFVVRARISGRTEDYSKEAFYRGYARERKLTLEDPLRFAAAHADANLPFSPERAFTGTWPDGEEGSLILRGDGSKREDRIAWVAGPKGPVSSRELKSTAPGLSVKDLDAYAIDLATAPADRP